MAQNDKGGVRVDKDAQRLGDPVTVVVTPEGREIDADTWSDANNLISQGGSFKAGYPTGPGGIAEATKAGSSTQTAESTKSGS